jgi:hypothetical protein
MCFDVFHFSVTSWDVLWRYSFTRLCALSAHLHNFASSYTARIRFFTAPNSLFILNCTVSFLLYCAAYMACPFQTLRMTWKTTKILCSGSWSKHNSNLKKKYPQNTVQCKVRWTLRKQQLTDNRKQKSGKMELHNSYGILPSYGGAARFILV